MGECVPEVVSNFDRWHVLVLCVSESEGRRQITQVEGCLCVWCKRREGKEFYGS